MLVCTSDAGEVNIYRSSIECTMKLSSVFLEDFKVLNWKPGGYIRKDSIMNRKTKPFGILVIRRESFDATPGASEV